MIDLNKDEVETVLFCLEQLEEYHLFYFINGQEDYIKKKAADNIVKYQKIIKKFDQLLEKLS